MMPWVLTAAFWAGASSSSGFVEPSNAKPAPSSVPAASLDEEDDPEGTDVDEPVNDEAAELWKLQEIEQQADLRLPISDEPGFPVDDLELAKRVSLFEHRAHPEEVSALLGTDPSLLFGTARRTALAVAEASWPLFVEYSGAGGLFDAKDYDIPLTVNPMVEQWIKFFTGRGREYFARWLSRSTRFIPLFRDIMKEHGLPQDTVYLAMIESGFNNRAFSRAKAAGPWQFMSYTGKRFGLKIDGWTDDRRDFIKATHAAAEYLKELHKQFKGDWFIAWAGYNAGGGKMSRAIAKYDTSDFFELTNPKKRYLKPETKNYVPKLIAAAIVAKSPKRFGFTEVEWLKPLDWETVEVEGPLELVYAAQAVDCDPDTLYELNPALKHGITPPGVTYALRIPRGTKAQFLAKLPEVLPKTRLTYKTHQARRGETLAGIAGRYGSTADVIRAQNRLPDGTSRLKFAQELLVPIIPGVPIVKSPAPRAEPSVRVAKHGEATPAPVATAAPADGRHLVEAGDSLWSISQRYGVGIPDLKRLNSIRNHRGLQVGQSIKLKD